MEQKNSQSQPGASDMISTLSNSARKPNGDISTRVQQTIESMVPRVEVYSIDEFFADLTGLSESLGDFARSIQARVKQWRGMPVGIGIEHTKTLAKTAQHASKLYKD